MKIIRGAALQAAAVLLASSCSVLSAAGADGPSGNAVNNEGISVRELGPVTIIYRSGGKSYVLDLPVGVQGGSTPVASQNAQMAATEEKTGRIRIEYVPPKNPAHQQVYELIKQRQVLENLQKIFGAFRLPVELVIKTVGCDGVSNAWYEREGKQPTVSLCYEYLQELWDGMPKETTAAGISPGDAIAGQLFFATAHEIGHAMFDIFDVPVFGRQEDAADQVSAYIMLQFGGDRAHRLVTGAAYGYRDFIKNYKEKPKVTLPLAAFSSDHGSPEERFYNLLCMAYGYDAKVFADLVEKEYLPASRAKKCRFEYKDLEYAFREVFGPHIDKDMAKQVLDTRWRTDAGPQPPGQ
jgi:hypothetical protein